MSRHRGVQNMLKHEDFGYDDDDYDDEYDGCDEPPPPPKAKPAKAKPAAKAAASKQPANKAAVERRVDSDGVAYTLAEFREFYGGDEEWKVATPVAPPPPPPPQPKKAAASSSPAPAPPPAFAHEAALQTMVGMGFPSDAARAALVSENGNLERAVQHFVDGGVGAAAAPAGSSSSGGGGSRTNKQAAAPPPPKLDPLPPPPPSNQLNMVVIGHVDAGKSTLMGRLLLLAGKVDQRTMHKYEKESQQVGKASFKYAWVMDQSEEERARGVTVDVGTAFFATPSGRLINVLDAPGHRDFVPNMIGGASQADLALLVVNSSPGEYESGLSGQTREHVTLARSLGVTRLLVAVNQMDSGDGWGSSTRFEEIVNGLTPLLTQIGYRDPPPKFIPVSALAGDNLAPGSLPSEASSWYQNGPSLLEAIDETGPLRRTSGVGTRLAVHDCFRGDFGGQLMLTGTLQAGTLSAGMKLLLLPAREQCIVKSLNSRGEVLSAAAGEKAEATAGDHVEVGIAFSNTSFDTSLVGAGSVLCDPSRPVPLAKRIEVQIRSLSEPLITGKVTLLTKGMPVELHAHAMTCAATLKKFLYPIDKKTGEVLLEGKAPRMLKPRDAAVVEIELEREVCVEVESDCKHLGRVVLRSEGETVAAGLVRAIVK